jgi:hypothetical protein
MTIQIDTREKARAIQKIRDYFNAMGVATIDSKLFVGDYMSYDNPRLIIDRKQNLQELCGNVCQQHKRFTAELQRANDAGIKLIILCEHGGGVKSLEDVKKWKNPRLKDSPLAVSGERLYKILSTMAVHYNVDFLFCDKRATGRRIIEILSGGANDS